MRRIATVPLVVLGLIASLPLVADTVLPHRPKALTERQEKAVADEIKAFRAKVAETIAKKDAAAIAALYADRFVHTHASGKVDDKRARVASVLAGHPAIEAAPATDLAFHAPAGWTAVVIGVSALHGHRVVDAESLVQVVVQQVHPDALHRVVDVTREAHRLAHVLGQVLAQLPVDVVDREQRVAPVAQRA